VLTLQTEDAGTTTVAPVLQGHVVFRQVTFRYPGGLEDALTDVSFDVLPGQKVALVGRSGSGKTTLFNLLMGLYPPTRGTIFLDQIDIGSIPKSDLRRQLGVVEQHPFLFEGTVRENIARTDPTASLDRIVDAARMAGAHDFIQALPAGYDTRIGERGVTLSGGERQRIVIARALAGHARMLLLDEATSAIDSRMERAIHGQIGASQDRRTMFVIAHRLSTVRDADLIVVLDQGRVVETGSHSDLMARRGLYWYLNTRSA
jgi:ATP-binding cassette subfamily B protein